MFGTVGKPNGGVHGLYFVAFQPMVGKLWIFKVFMSYKN